MIHYKKHDHSLIIDLPVCLQRINHYSKRGDDPPQKAWPFLKHRFDRLQRKGLIFFQREI